MQPGRVAVVDSQARNELTRAQLLDAIAATMPDAVVAASPGARVRLRSELPDLDPPVVAPESEATGGEPSLHRLGGVQLAVVGSDASPAGLAALEAEGNLDPSTETYVLTDRLGLSVRPAELTTVREGVEAYRGAITTGERDADRSLRGSYTHLSTALPADYYGEWAGLTVRGVAPGGLDGALDGGDGIASASVASLVLGTNGTVASEALRADSLGLRAIDGVGEQRAATLREAGFADRETLAAADVATVADLDELSRSTAIRLVDRARAFEDGRVLRRTDERLPRSEPIFVDVETDGLSPSTAWLIGVLDRDGEPAYRSFLAGDPDRPSAALEAFCGWLADRQANRPIVAYNGRRFDVPVLSKLIDRHCPAFREPWADAWTFDPLAWAVRDGNAVLPGRTNRLADVAAALGFEADAATGAGRPLDGAEVARIYRTWRANPSPATEPDWETLERYCETDVRALAYVYDAVAAANRTAGETPGREPTAKTTQGSLGDF